MLKEYSSYALPSITLYQLLRTQCNALYTALYEYYATRCVFKAAMQSVIQYVVRQIISRLSIMASKTLLGVSI